MTRQEFLSGSPFKLSEKSSMSYKYVPDISGIGDPGHIEVICPHFPERSDHYANVKEISMVVAHCYQIFFTMPVEVYLGLDSLIKI